jgi:hypothetical protein
VPAGQFRWGHKFESGSNRLEKGAKFATAETRLLDALPASDAAPRHIGMFAGIVFRAGVQRRLEVSVYDILDVSQQQARPLLPFIIDEKNKFALVAICRLARCLVEELLADFVAPDGIELDGLQHVNAIDHPSDGRLQ